MFRAARYGVGAAMLVIVPVLVVLFPDAFGELLVLEIFFAVNFVALRYNQHSIDPRSTWEGARGMAALACAATITAIFYPSVLAFAVVAGSALVAIAYAWMAWRGAQSSQTNATGD